MTPQFCPARPARVKCGRGVLDPYPRAGDAAPTSRGRSDATTFDLDQVRRAKGATTVAVVVPARNEADHRRRGPRRRPPPTTTSSTSSWSSNDDSRRRHRHRGRRTTARGWSSSTAPAARARRCGAGLAATSSDLVVFLDADVINTTSDFVARLISPLLSRDRDPTRQGLSTSGRCTTCRPAAGGSTSWRRARSCRCSTPASARSASPSRARPPRGAARSTPSHSSRPTAWRSPCSSTWRAPVRRREPGAGRPRRATPPQPTARRAATDGHGRAARRARALRRRAPRHLISR